MVKMDYRKIMIKKRRKKEYTKEKMHQNMEKRRPKIKLVQTS